MEETVNPATNATKEFYSLEEVAQLLGVNYQLIYKVVRAGELAAARIGKVYRVARVDLDAYLERSKTQAAGGACSVCHNIYHSRLSLKHRCGECGEPICGHCWSGKRARFCPEHSGGPGGNPVAGEGTGTMEK